jgi:putative ABC transport system substrate-binding protein
MHARMTVEFLENGRRPMTFRTLHCALIALLCCVSALVVSAPDAVLAQQHTKVARVGVLTPGETDNTPGFVALRNGLRELGYVEGKSLILDFRLAKGHNDRLGDLASELVQIPVDVIVASGTTAAQAAARSTRQIPIIQAAGGDPVAAGLAASLARPGGNVTGFTIRTDEPSGKRLELLKLAFPKITRVVVMFDPTSVVTERQLRATARVAATLEVQLATLPVSNPDELRALQPGALSGSDGFLVLPSAMFWNQRATIIALAAAARVPAMYPEREYAEDGGLAAYGANVPDAYRRTAGYVDRILRGTKPGDLPIEEASKFDFIVNLRTARALGLPMSTNFVVGVGEVIE